MYCIFVDFVKAFDSNTIVYYYELIQMELMLNFFSACVRNIEVLTIYFGTRQGYMVTPISFGFFLNEYALMPANFSCIGIQIDSVNDLLTLLYADDKANIADKVKHAQKRINILDKIHMVLELPWETLK